MLYVLEPIPVDPCCTLNEALYWVAYRQYATGWNSFAEEGEQDDIVEALFERDRIIRPFVEKEDYKAKLLNKLGLTLPDEPPSILEHEDLSSLSGEKRRQLVEASHKAYNEYRAEIANIENYCLAPYKSELFLKLRNGDIETYGQLRARLKKDVPSSRWNEDSSWEEVEYKSVRIYMCQLEALDAGETVSGFQKIPASFWDSDGILWDEDYARSRLGCYHWIFMRSEQLFKHFPHIAGNPVGIEERAGLFIYDDQKMDSNALQQIKSRRGRPAHNWPEFHAEIVRYALESGDLPDKQTALERHMEMWCQQQWGFVPGHGTIHTQISPLYARKKKVKKSVA